MEEFCWDAENRLIEYYHYPSEISTPDRVARYGYDGLGRRHMKEVNGVRQYILWNGDEEYEIMDSSGNCLERYQQGMTIDGIEGRQIRQSSLSDRYIKDHLGSVQKVIREYGTEENEYIYDSFGNIIYQTDSLSNHRLYTSRFFDSETGLYYYRARYYDPETGRFLSEDPMGIERVEREYFEFMLSEGGLDSIILPVFSAKHDWENSLKSLRGRNLYIYVENNTVNLLDPTGLKSKKCCGTWKGIGIRIANFYCRCYWLCIPLNGAVIWDGNWLARPSTRGIIIYTGGGALKRGDSCFCKTPDNEAYIAKLKN